MVTVEIPLAAATEAQVWGGSWNRKPGKSAALRMRCHWTEMLFTWRLGGRAGNRKGQSIL